MPGIWDVTEAGAPDQIDCGVAESRQRECDFASMKKIFGIGGVAHVEDTVLDGPPCLLPCLSIHPAFLIVAQAYSCIVGGLISPKTLAVLIDSTLTFW